MDTELFDTTLFYKKLYRLKIVFVFIASLSALAAGFLALGFFSSVLERADWYIVYFTAAFLFSIAVSALSSLYIKPVSPSEQKFWFYSFYLGNTASAAMSAFLSVPMGFIAARSFSRGEFSSGIFELILSLIPLCILISNIAALNLAGALSKAFDEPEEIAPSEDSPAEEEPDVNAIDHEGLTPLMRAVIARDAALVKELCDYPKTDVDFISPATGTTAFWIAAAGGDKEITELLLWRGADAKSANRQGLSAKDAAKENGFFEVAVLISEHEE